MRESNILDTDVDLGELASLTKNYSGAEIAGSCLDSFFFFFFF